MKHKLLIHWQRFGPYHLARLQSAKKMLGPCDWAVVGLEIASTDNVYPWDGSHRQNDTGIITAFPSEGYDSIGHARMLMRLWKILEAERPDAVAICGYSTMDSLALLFWSRFRRVPSILMFETCVFDRPRNHIVGLAKRFLVRLFDTAICGGLRHAWYLRSMGFPGARIALGYDVVDDAYFAKNAGTGQLPAESSIFDRDIPGCFLASSRFVERKNISGLVRAYREYATTTNMPWPLLILGDGPLMAEILAEASTVPHNLVRIVGFKQYHELPKYYGVASVFIHPAHREAWGLVVNEAIATGLPILVGERVGCAVDLVVNGLNGYRFNTERQAALTGLMRHFASLSVEERAKMGKWSRMISRSVGIARFGQGLAECIKQGSKTKPLELSRDRKRVDAFGSVRMWMPEAVISVGRAIKYKWMFFSARRYADTQGYYVHVTGCASKFRNRFAFIVGAGRSGTTILGTVLGMHPEVIYKFEPYHLWTAIREDMDLTNIFGDVDSRYGMAADDVRPFDQARFQVLFDHRTGSKAAKLVVEKMPHNVVRMRYISALIPEAKFVHIVRDGCDVAGSIEQISIFGNYRMFGQKHYHQWWGVNHSKWHAILRDAEKFGLPLDEVAGLTSDLQRGAVEWLISCQAAEAYRRDHQDAFVEIRYTDLVRSTSSVLRLLARELNLNISSGWLEKATAEVQDYSRSRTIDLRLPRELQLKFNNMQEHFGFKQRAGESFVGGMGEAAGVSR